MKALLKTLTIATVATLLFVYGCDKNPASPDDSSSDELNNTEKMLIVSAEVAEASGGIMTDLNMVDETTGNFSSGLKKAVSFDTTITQEWITYSLHLSYYAENGNEQPIYVENRTDKIVYQGQLTGANTMNGANSNLAVNLKRNSSLEITDVISDTLNVNGTSSNSSQYEFSYNNVSLAVLPTSTLKLNNVKINTNSGSYIPYSGKVEANIKGTFSKKGGLKDADTNYDFDCTIEFTGNSKVTVTLPNGSKFLLDLETGDFSRIN